MKIRQVWFLIVVCYCLPLFALTPDPLPSWQNTSIKQSIYHFVQKVTDPHSVYYVAPEDRIAAFDNDGTVWLEKPMYSQVIFTFDRIKQLAPTHPGWKTQPPFSLVLQSDFKALSQLDKTDLAKIIAVTQAGMTVEQFQQMVKEWLEHTINPRFKKPYAKLIYEPMLEVMSYLHAQQFKVYLVTGSGQDFARVIAKMAYHMQPDQVIGTTFKTKYTNEHGKPVLLKIPEILFVDDKTGKPEAINLFLGKKPIIAFGNSDGDEQMLEWTQSGSGLRLMLLVKHDDAKREYAYGPESKVGTFSNALQKIALKSNWEIISMKNDWKTVFSN